MHRREGRATIAGMTLPSLFADTPEHRILLEEYLDLDSDEVRLEWLMERPMLHHQVPEDLRTAALRVPGCLSGLWLHTELREGKSFFASYSDSAMVQGITSFLCDLHSGRSPEEILSINLELARLLGLERLLSMNRKRAVLSVMNYILAQARHHLATLHPATASEAV